MAPGVDNRPVRAFAFYLPQFHPIPENDRWWGPGFTEWRNVVRVRPQFPGHHQPHLPADLGFYDLRVPEVRDAQAELARQAGLAGFCYYHYWFSGRRLLERPFDEVLASGRPDLPFLLCWANESWTRAWDGKTGHHLVEQRYSDADDVAHLRHLAPTFADPRYARIDDKPAFLVYRASELPDARRTTDAWRSEAARLGIGELFLARVDSGPDERDDPVSLGFDAAVEFQPDWRRLHGRTHRSRPRQLARRAGLGHAAYDLHRVFDYEAIVDRMLARPEPPYRRLPCVTPRWDNTARRPTGATILARSTPEAYHRWLSAAVDSQRGAADPVVFVNAWNEWAEGAHLEPDLTWGHAYLDATRAALEGRPCPPAQPRPVDLVDEPSATPVARAAASARHRVRRSRRRASQRWRAARRPVARRLEDVSRRAGTGGRGEVAAPRAVFACVTRARHAGTVSRLVADAERAGWRVALWSLDDGGGDRHVVGTGPGDRTDLLRKLVAHLDPGPDEYVVLADDDIELVRGDLGSLADIVRRARLDLAMAAHARSSHAWHRITEARPATTARLTGFVEIGPLLVIGPAHRAEVLASMEGAGMGWGLEVEWSALQRHGARLGIVDACTIRHLDPPAAAYEADAERRRLGERLAAAGIDRLEDLQVTHAVWRRWQRHPPW